MRASRLLSMLVALQSRGRMSGQALADEFEVSIRTIYRDIDELSGAGIPVISERGPGGGFALKDGYRTKLNGLSQQEAAALLLIGAAAPMAQLGLGPAITSVERKLLAALPPELTIKARQAQRRIHIDAVNWYQQIERPVFLSSVAAAVWEQTKLDIEYDAWTRKSAVVMDPFGLVIKAGVWYVVARVGCKLRTFKVSQITACSHRDERFTIPESFDLALHWTAETERFETRLLKRSALVRFAPKAMRRIDHLGATAARAVREVTPDVDGWRTARVPVEESDHSLCELFGIGPYIEILEPSDLRMRAREFAQRLLRQHRGMGTHQKRNGK